MVVIIVVGYFFGGFLLFILYFFVVGYIGKLMMGLYILIGVMGVVLFMFGYVKMVVVVGFGR